MVIECKCMMCRDSHLAEMVCISQHDGTLICLTWCISAVLVSQKSEDTLWDSFLWSLLEPPIITCIIYMPEDIVFFQFLKMTPFELAVINPRSSHPIWIGSVPFLWTVPIGFYHNKFARCIAIKHWGRQNKGYVIWSPLFHFLYFIVFIVFSCLPF